MSDRDPKLHLDNRRFLVSVWHPRSVDLDDGFLDSVKGAVWEADPGDPGRIAAPSGFVGLPSLVRVLGKLIKAGRTETPSGGISNEASKDREDST